MESSLLLQANERQKEGEHADERDHGTGRNRNPISQVPPTSSRDCQDDGGISDEQAGKDAVIRASERLRRQGDAEHDATCD